MEHFNFGAGPSMLPEEVKERIKNDLPFWNNNMSVMEVSHRSKEFEQVIERTESNIRLLLDIPNDYKVLFIPGGARNQFSMIPINLLGKNKYADYIISGLWSKLAYEDGCLFCNASIAATNEYSNFKAIPSEKTWNLDPKAAFVHYTENETAHGVEFHTTPNVGEISLVTDMTSSILTKPFDVKKYSVIYASAQKNMGIAGITVVIINTKCLKAPLNKTPPLLDYSILIKRKSILNTPPVFSWYVLDLMLSWTLKHGGVKAFYEKSIQKSKKLYDFIDKSAFYYNEVIDKDRSRINVPFFFREPELESKFVEYAASYNITQIKGHKIAGGMRASLYNAMPIEGVDLLIEVMQEFEKKYT